MNIVISQRIGQNQHGTIIDSLESDYTVYFSKLGTVIPIPNFPFNFELFVTSMKIDRIILSGGNDIDEKNDYIKLRNEIEKKLLSLSIKKRIPLLGICRGMQFINNYFDGKLKSVKNHVRVVHTVQIVSKEFPKFFLSKTSIAVNSYHNFSVDENSLSPDIEIFAKSLEDNSIEGIYHKNYPIFGILWHPERKMLPQDVKFNSKLIKEFINQQ